MQELILSGKTNIALSQLQCQYIPKIFLPNIWGAEKCMDISNSPHVALLEAYNIHGLKWDLLFQTGYAKMFEEWNKIGYDINGKKRTKNYIKSKIKSLIKLYITIKRKGYERSKRIGVLDKPFWISRYNYKFDFPNNSYEIWHGHHRAACCYALGIEYVPSLIYRDAKPGVKKCVKWDRRLKGVGIGFY